MLLTLSDPRPLSKIVQSLQKWDSNLLQLIDILNQLRPDCTEEKNGTHMYNIDPVNVIAGKM